MRQRILSNQSLLERQTRLLEHLTSTEFIFGRGNTEEAFSDPGIRGLDIGRLRLEAEFSYGKRLERIVQIFSRTFQYYPGDAAALRRGFVDTNPPRTYERYPDARAFYDYLVERWKNEPADPAFLSDIAKFEITMCKVRTFRPSEVNRSSAENPPTGPVFRLHPCADIVSFEHDIRKIVSPKGSSLAPSRERIFVVVAMVEGRRQPLILDIPENSFEILDAARDWTPFDPKDLTVQDGNATPALIARRLQPKGILQVTGLNAGDG